MLGADSGLNNAQSIDELRKMLLAAPVVRCDEITLVAVRPIDSDLECAGMYRAFCILRRCGLASVEGEICMTDHRSEPTPTKKRTEHGILPGDLPTEKLLERIVRVDHAGEYGAVRIS